MSKCKLCGDTHPDRYIKKHELCRVCYEAIRKFMMDDIGYYDPDRIPNYYTARKKQRRREMSDDEINRFIDKMINVEDWEESLLNVWAIFSIGLVKRYFTERV